MIQYETGNGELRKTRAYEEDMMGVRYYIYEGWVVGTGADWTATV